MNMAAMAKIVCSTSVFTAWNSLRDFCDLMQSDNSMNELRLRLFISLATKHFTNWATRHPGFALRKAVHGRPIEYQWIRNGTGFMVRKSPYSFKRL